MNPIFKGTKLKHRGHKRQCPATFQSFMSTPYLCVFVYHRVIFLMTTFSYLICVAPCDHFDDNFLISCHLPSNCFLISDFCSTMSSSRLLLSFVQHRVIFLVTTYLYLICVASCHLFRDYSSYLIYIAQCHLFDDYFLIPNLHNIMYHSGDYFLLTDLLASCIFRVTQIYLHSFNFCQCCAKSKR